MMKTIVAFLAFASCCFALPIPRTSIWHNFKVDTSQPTTFTIGYINFETESWVRPDSYIGSNVEITGVGIYLVEDDNMDAFLSYATNNFDDIMGVCINGTYTITEQEYSFYEGVGDLSGVDVQSVLINVSDYTDKYMIARYEFLPEPTTLLLFLVACGLTTIRRGNELPKG